MFLVRVKVPSLNIKRDHFFLVLTEKRKFEKGKKGGNLRKELLASLGWVNDLHSELYFRLLSWRQQSGTHSIITCVMWFI